MLIKRSSVKAAFFKPPPECWGSRLLSAGVKGSGGKPRSFLAPMAYGYAKHDLRPPLYMYIYFLLTEIYTYAFFGRGLLPVLSLEIHAAWSVAKHHLRHG